MSDINRRGKTTAKKRCRDRGQTVHSQRSRRVEAVARRLGRFDVLQAAQDVEQAHRHNDRQIAGPLLGIVANLAQKMQKRLARKSRHIKPAGLPCQFHRVDAHRRSGQFLGEESRQRPCAERPQQNGHKSAGKSQRKTDPRKVGDEDDCQWQHGNQRPLIDLQRELHRDEADRDSGQRRQQGRPRRAAAHGLRDKRPKELDQPASQAGDHPGLPGRLGTLRALEHGEHHKEDVNQQRRRVDAEGERGDVAAPRCPRDQMGLHSVEHVANQDADRRARQNVRQHQLRIGLDAAELAELHDQQQLNQIVDEEPKESVKIALHEERIRCLAHADSLRGWFHFQERRPRVANMHFLTRDV